MSAASDGDGRDNPGVGSQLATLVPSFDPSVDNMLEYQQKVELVLMAWPKNRITELTTRLILNCKRFCILQITASSVRVDGQ